MGTNKELNVACSDERLDVLLKVLWAVEAKPCMETPASQNKQHSIPQENTTSSQDCGCQCNKTSMSEVWDNNCPHGSTPLIKVCAGEQAFNFNSTTTSAVIALKTSEMHTESSPPVWTSDLPGVHRTRHSCIALHLLGTPRQLLQCQAKIP